MPDFGIGEAIAAIAAIGSEVGADVGAGAAAIGSGLGGLGEAAAGGLGAVEGGLASAGAGIGDLLGLGGAAEGAGGAAGGLGGLAAGGAVDPAAAAAAGAGSAAAGGAAPAGAGAIDLASTAGAGGTQALGFAPDIASADFIMPDGTFLAGPGSAASTGADVAGAATSGATAGGGAGGIAGGGASAVAGGGTTGLAGAGGGDLASLAGAGGGVSDPLAGGAGGGGGFFSDLGSGAISSLTKNPLGIAAAGAGLGYNMLQSNKQSANQQALSGIASQEAAQGAQLQSYLNNGTLPPGMQAQVDNAKQAAKAQIISGYAAKGMSADPSQNSALAQELAAVETNALELQGKIATNLLTAGINETNMSGNLFQALIQMDQTQAKQMGSAIANFSAALAGGPKSISIGGATG